MSHSPVPARDVDVVVAGGGIAGISAAVAAAEAGASVVLLEKAPQDRRGGNTRFSDAQIRLPREADEFSPVSTTREQMFEDFMRVTHGRANEDLVHVLVEHAADSVDWLSERGVRWEQGFPHTATYRRRPVNGGLGILEALYDVGESLGVTFHYDTEARKLIQDPAGRVVGVRTVGPDGYRDFRATGGVILATGGFQSNLEMRARYLGGWSEHLILRGTRYDTGDGHRMALDIGAQPAGQWGDYHSAVLDSNSPPMEGGVAAIYIYQLGLIVNEHGQRFLDEGEDFRDNTYVKFSKLITQQEDGISYVIFDQQARRDPAWDRGVRMISPPIEADTLNELAGKIGLPAEEFLSTVRDYNQAVDRDTPFHADRKDGKAALGIHPPKSNWARPIEEPPYIAYGITGGMTFTFGGLKTTAKAQVIDLRDRVIPGLYAAGETQGEFFYYNYPGATSVLRGLVFGRVAGADAVSLSRGTPASFHDLIVGGGA